MNAQQSKRRIHRAETHRRAQGDELELLEKLARILSGDAAEQVEGFCLEAMTLRSARGEDLPFADVVRRAAHLIRGYRGNARAEERLAWDAYAAAAAASTITVSKDGSIHVDSDGAAEYADELLEERRKRFSPESKP